MPPILRFFINVFLYLIYVLFFSVLFSIAFPAIQNMLGQTVWVPSDPRFAKIQIFIAIFVLLLSLIFRKYFYLSGWSDTKQTGGSQKTSPKTSYTATKKAAKSDDMSSSTDDNASDEEIVVVVENK